MMHRPSPRRRALATTCALLAMLAACGPSDPPATQAPAPDMATDLGVVADMTETPDSPADMPAIEDMGADMPIVDEDMGGAEDMGADMTIEQDMGPPDLCDPNPCTEPNRNICSQRGAVVVCGCNDGYSDQGGQCEPDPICGANACTEPNRSVCAEQGGVAVCSCDPGYEERDGACVLADLCEPNPCTEPNRTACAEGANQTVTCSCDAGYQDEGGACVPEDPCAPNPCADPNKTSCSAQNGQAVCACDVGFEDDGNGTCRDVDLCDPNPCTDANKTSCSVLNDQAVCACDMGYQDDGSGGCVVIPPPTCANQHSDGDSYEPDECVSLATPLVLGMTQNHTIEPAGDVDFVSFTVQAGEIVRFEETTGTDTYSTLYDADGSTVLRNTDSEAWRWEFDAAGTYYVRVRHYSSTRTGPTSFSISSLGFDDHGDTTAAATTSPTMTSPLVGEVETSGDYDVFAITVPAGQILRFEETTGTDIYSTLYDADGTTILRNTDNESWNWEFGAAGTYYVRVRHYSSSSIGSYNVNVLDLGFDDHGDTTAEATQTASTTSPLTGDIETRGDHDVFAITVAAGRILRFEETTSTDVYFTLYDTDGATILRNTDNESWNWEFGAAGTYYVRVRHYSSASIGAFNVTIADLGLDDHGDTYQDASPVSAGSTTDGDIETRGDQDFFSFTAQAGHIYRIEEVTGTDVWMELRTDSGSVLRSSDNEWMQWEFATAGTYIVGVRHYSSTSIGTYQLKITDLGLDDHGDAPGEGTPVSMSQTISGEIETYGDRDVFELVVSQPGEVWTIEETSSTDVIYTLYDTDGATALYTANNTERIAWRFDTPGTYAISLRHGSSARIDPYTLVFTRQPDDDHGDSAASASPLTPDGAAQTGIISHTGDVDWFTLTTTAGQVYSVQISGNTRWRATLYDGTGVNLIQSVTNGTMYPTLAASTTYLIKVDSTSTITTGSYQLTVSD